jgi:hypothetical protein
MIIHRRESSKSSGKSSRSSRRGSSNTVGGGAHGKGAVVAIEGFEAAVKAPKVPTAESTIIEGDERLSSRTVKVYDLSVTQDLIDELEEEVIYLRGKCAISMHEE